MKCKKLKIRKGSKVAFVRILRPAHEGKIILPDETYEISGGTEIYPFRPSFLFIGRIESLDPNYSKELKKGDLICFPASATLGVSFHSAIHKNECYFVDLESCLFKVLTPNVQILRTKIRRTLKP